MALIPNSIIAGDSLKITVPNASEKTCKVTISGEKTKFTKTAAVDSGSYVALFTSAETSALVAGKYAVHIGLFDGNERETLATGYMNVTADITASASDFRTTYEKQLDAINAALEGRATTAQDEVMINGRSIKYMNIQELIKWQNHCKNQIAREKREERLKAGLGGAGIIRARF